MRTSSKRRQDAPTWKIHPGEILRDEFLKPLALSEYALAKGLRVTAQRINDITKKKSGISAEMALLLAKYFDTTPQFWMNLQTTYELTRAEKAASQKLGRIKPRKAAA